MNQPPHPSTPPPDPAGELERWAKTQLGALPPRRAPQSLIPRVMATIQARAIRPWHERPWLEWPWRYRLLSLCLVGALLGGLLWADVQFAAFHAQVARLGEWVVDIGGAILALLTVLANALVLICRNLNPWIWGAMLLFFGMLYLTCLGLGTAFVRVAMGQRS